MLSHLLRFLTLRSSTASVKQWHGVCHSAFTAVYCDESDITLNIVRPQFAFANRHTRIALDASVVGPYVQVLLRRGQTLVLPFLWTYSCKEPHARSEFSGKTPCPFLKGGECSIYDSRPLTCRMHLNFDIDPYWCLHENWTRPEALIPRPDITPLMEAYHALAGKVRPVVADIRDFFPQGNIERVHV